MLVWRMWLGDPFDGIHINRYMWRFTKDDKILIEMLQNQLIVLRYRLLFQSLLNTLSKILYCYACMPDVAFDALLSCTNIVNALLKEVMKALIWILLI